MKKIHWEYRAVDSKKPDSATTIIPPNSSTAEKRVFVIVELCKENMYSVQADSTKYSARILFCFLHNFLGIAANLLNLRCVVVR